MFLAVCFFLFIFLLFFFFNDTATTEIYTLSLHDALPIYAQIAYATKTTEDIVRTRRKQLGVIPAYKMVDTCAAEFASETPYYYSSYDDENEILPSDKPKVMILGGGPNRIGQGIELDRKSTRLNSSH